MVWKATFTLPLYCANIDLQEWLNYSKGQNEPNKEVVSTSGACWGCKGNPCCQGGILEIGFWDASRPTNQSERGIAKYAKHSSGSGKPRNAAATSSDQAQICLFQLFQPFEPAQW